MKERKVYKRKSPDKIGAIDIESFIA